MVPVRTPVRSRCLAARSCRVTCVCVTVWAAVRGGWRCPDLIQSVSPPDVIRPRAAGGVRRPLSIVCLQYLHPNLRAAFTICGVTDAVLAHTYMANLVHEYMTNVNMMERLLTRISPQGMSDDADYQPLLKNLTNFASSLRARMSKIIQSETAADAAAASSTERINLFLQVRYFHPVVQDILTQAGANSDKLVHEEKTILNFLVSQNVGALVQQAERQLSSTAQATGAITQQPSEGSAAAAAPLLDSGDNLIYQATTINFKGNTYDLVPGQTQTQLYVTYDDANESQGASCLNCFSSRGGSFSSQFRSSLRRGSDWIRSSIRGSRAPVSRRVGAAGEWRQRDPKGRVDEVREDVDGGGSGSATRTVSEHVPIRQYNSDRSSADVRTMAVLTATRNNGSDPTTENCVDNPSFTSSEAPRQEETRLVRSGDDDDSSSNDEFTRATAVTAPPKPPRVHAAAVTGGDDNGVESSPIPQPRVKKALRQQSGAGGDGELPEVHQAVSQQSSLRSRPTPRLPSGKPRVPQPLTGAGTTATPAAAHG